MNTTTELARHIKSALSQVSRGPYRWGVIESDTDQKKHVDELFSKGSGPIHLVILPEHPGTVLGDDPDRPDHAVHLCVTGNGPNSEANAVGIAEILKHLPELIERVAQIETGRDGWKREAEAARVALDTAISRYDERFFWDVRFRCQEYGLWQEARAANDARAGNGGRDEQA